MAFNELQSYGQDKSALYRNVQDVAGETARYFLRLQSFVDRLNDYTGADLTALGIPAEVQTMLAQYRTRLNWLVAFYTAGDATGVTEAPQVLMEDIRKMLII